MTCSRTLPGLAADGRETFVYIDGAIQHPEPWTDDALAHLGKLIRGLHDATADFMPSPDAVWRPHFARDLPGSDPVIGHGDLGPWNILSRNGQPVAIIDWDYAGPIDRLWELAQAAWLNVQLHDDDVAQGHGLGDAQTRGNQLRIFLDAYGLARNEREGFVHRIAEYAIHDVRQEAIEHNITSSTTIGVSESGYPITWALAWRSRSASWILRHRTILEGAIL